MIVQAAFFCVADAPNLVILQVEPGSYCKNIECPSDLILERIGITFS